MHGQTRADPVEMDWEQREGVGVSPVPFSHHVPGEYADSRAHPNGGLCTPADHGARAEAAVVHIGEVVSEGDAEEGWEGGTNVLVEAIRGSEKRTCFWREGEGDAPGGRHLRSPGARLRSAAGARMMRVGTPCIYTGVREISTGAARRSSEWELTSSRQMRGGGGEFSEQATGAVQRGCSIAT